jgi:hypothetical protein
MTLPPKLMALIAGSKDWLDRKSVYDALDALAPDFLIHGSLGHSVSIAKKGTDLFATEWAQKRGVPYLVAPPLWEVHGKAAGSVRNHLMLWVGESLASASGAKLVVAALPGVSRAAESLVVLARSRGITVIEHEFDGSVKQARTSSGGEPEFRQRPGGGTWNR